MAPLLPFELVAKIIEYAHYLEAHGPYVDVKTLSACAAVCRQWSSFARNLLFFRFELARSLSDDFLAEGIPLLSGPGGFGACIRSITLLDRAPSGVDFITVLSHCPALYELKLSTITNILELSEPDVARLIALPVRIRALTLKTFHEHWRRLKSRLLYQLLAIWPDIQSLRVCNLEFLGPPPAERPPFSLFELEIANEDPISGHILRWLLPPIPAGERGSLNILSITFEFDTDSVLNEYAPYVRSLKLSRIGPLEQPLQENIARFSELEELVLGQSFEFRELQMSPNAVPLPQTIQHLWIAALDEESMWSVRWMLALLDMGIPRLKRVSVDGSDPDQLVDLAHMCANKGVGLVRASQFHPNNSKAWMSGPRR